MLEKERGKVVAHSQLWEGKFRVFGLISLVINQKIKKPPVHGSTIF